SAKTTRICEPRKRASWYGSKSRTAVSTTRSGTTGADPGDALRQSLQRVPGDDRERKHIEEARAVVLGHVEVSMGVEPGNWSFAPPAATPAVVPIALLQLPAMTSGNRRC